MNWTGLSLNFRSSSLKHACSSHCSLKCFVVHMQPKAKAMMGFSLNLLLLNKCKIYYLEDLRNVHKLQAPAANTCAAKCMTAINARGMWARGNRQTSCCCPTSSNTLEQNSHHPPSSAFHAFNTGLACWAPTFCSNSWMKKGRVKCTLSQINRMFQHVCLCFTFMKSSFIFAAANVDLLWLKPHKNMAFLWLIIINNV